MTQRIFEGLKVIDCATYIAAPAAATVLADFGASVTKIEPLDGDPYRRLSSLPGYPRSEHNYCWMLESRNKRSLALNLSKPDGQAVLHRLLNETDVFITNFPPAVRKRLGITYETLRPLNERMIYASFTGYGEKGEEANKPGFDSNAWWARSGLMDSVKPYTGAQPSRSVPGMGDHPSSLALYSAIVTALYQRGRTGMGAHVSSSLFANGVWSAGCFAQAALCGAEFLDRPPREQALNAITNHYQCRDGRWLMLSLLNDEREFPILAKCLGVEHLVADPRFATKADRQKRAPELTKIFDAVFATADLSEWRARLDAAGLVFGLVAVMSDLPHDRQMLANDVLVPCADGVLTINSPFWVDGSDKVPPGAAPTLGEHSDAVLREAGYDDDKISELRAGGVVG